MKTGYRIWTKPQPTAVYVPGDLFDDLAAAKAATGYADTPWATNGEGNHWPEDTGRLLFVGEEQVPESIEDRVQLAIDLIVECGWMEDVHHKAWVIDQVVRTLAGGRYEQIVAEACASGGEWDKGIAP